MLSQFLKEIGPRAFGILDLRKSILCASYTAQQSWFCLSAVRPLRRRCERAPSFPLFLFSGEYFMRLWLHVVTRTHSHSPAVRGVETEILLEDGER
ncbi:hypothetical protein Bca4012_088973 [Brassica carinata]